MAGLPLLLVLAVTALVGIGVAVVRRSPPSREGSVAAARRHATTASVGAVAAGVLAALVVPFSDGSWGTGEPASGGRELMLVPLAFGIAHTVVLTVGELTWPRPAGQVRRARLVRRGPLDAAPAGLVRSAGAAVVLAVLTVVVGALVADGDGRGISRSGELWARSSGPFPGWFYGGPALAGLALLVALVGAALWVVATRAAVLTADDRIEAALRSASAHRVLRGATAAVLLLAGGLLGVAGTAAHSLGSGPTPSPLGPVGAAVAVLGLACVAAGLVVLCRRAPGVPADQPVPA
ncbi:hypothetical protein [Modestobacter marinus]|uniref:hypothetical protein n=1 Tax=Modestobacter marinus TaxID=477641 RepID=UPI001C977F66|nr:hypothetical protein [Modestobacter marinus]